MTAILIVLIYFAIIIGIATKFNHKSKRSHDKYQTVNSHYSDATLHPNKSVGNGSMVSQYVSQSVQYIKQTRRHKDSPLYSLEDRTSDWLAQQLRRERMLQGSAFLHQMNCDAKALKREHELQHNNIHNMTKF